jgi:hypothetical protein
MGLQGDLTPLRRSPKTASSPRPSRPCPAGASQCG